MMEDMPEALRLRVRRFFPPFAFALRFVDLRALVLRVFVLRPPFILRVAFLAFFLRLTICFSPFMQGTEVWPFP